jgi:hypothetical protein
MSTIQQIEANRLNAQKSTGPRSPEGKAVSRFNATKTGIDAKSQIVPGEDPVELDTLAAEYQERWQPATPEQRLLVDTLVDCEWLLRRFRRSEAQLWQCKMQKAKIWKPDPECLLGLGFDYGCEQFTRLQRRIDSTSRNYHRALKELQRLESQGRQSEPPPAPASEASPVGPSQGKSQNEPNSGIASLADAASSPTPPPPSAPFPHPLSPPQHPLAEQS